MLDVPIFALIPLKSMNKTTINTLIKNMKKAGVITRASEWSNEGTPAVEVIAKYVGIKLDDSWTELFSTKNNILLKFILKKEAVFLEYYLANTPPFILISTVRVQPTDKWETLLGELKLQLKKDKKAVQQHTARIDNLFARIQSKLQ